MVVTRAPATAESVVTHERTALPFTCTVQAPHCAIPQPYFVPVSFSSSRITQRSEVLPSALAATIFPLRVNETILPPDKKRLGRAHPDPPDEEFQLLSRSARTPPASHGRRRREN